MRIASSMRQAFTGLCVATCVSLIGTTISWGDTTFYADVDGGGVQYTEICETTTESFELFGQPQMLEEALFTDSGGFSTNSADAFEFIQGTLSMTITATGDNLIDSIDFSDFGSYFVFGQDAMISASTQGFVESGGEFYFGESEFSSSSGNGVWDTGFEILFPATQSLTLTINSQLFSTSGLGEAAFIDKAGGIINVGFTTAVPEPAACSLLALAATGLLIRRRK